MSKNLNYFTEKQQLQEEQYVFPYHYLDLVVDIYRDLLYIEYISYMNIVKDIVSPFHGQSILDAGCGDGRFCYEIKNEDVKIIGVDFSDRAIAFAKAFNPEVEFHVADLKDFHYDEAFDFIVLIETLEHFIPEDIPDILKNLNSLLKKDGKLVLTVPSVNRPLSPKHYQHFSKESLEQTLMPYFEIIEIFGYDKVGLRRNIFRIMRKLSIISYPLKEMLPFLRSFYRIIQLYYKNNLAIGKPEECRGLVAVCKKNTVSV